MSEFGAAFLRQVDSFCGPAPELAQHLGRYSILGQKKLSGPPYSSPPSISQIWTQAFEQLHELREFLLAKRPFILALLQNPSLLEHDTFTDLLWAVCHLTEELECRSDIRNPARFPISSI